MAQVSRRVVDPRVSDKMERLLRDCLTRCRDQDTTMQFIDDLLTSTERVMIAKRLAIALMLLKKRTFEEIGETLKVSVQTIWTVQGWLRARGKGFRTLLETVIRHDTQHEKEHTGAISDAESFLPPTPGRDWKAARHRRWKRVDETQEPF